LVSKAIPGIQNPIPNSGDIPTETDSKSVENTPDIPTKLKNPNRDEPVAKCSFFCL
jgi:hypothetical protein